MTPRIAKITAIKINDSTSATIIFETIVNPLVAFL